MGERQYHICTNEGEIAPYVLLPGDPHRVEMIAKLWDEAHFVADNREFITYTGTYKGMPISCTSSGIGGPSTAIALEELAKCGAKTFVRMGTCGGITEEIQRNDIVIIDSACRFEGTTRCYAPIEFPAVADHEIVEAQIQTVRQKGLRYYVGTSRCIDGLYTNRPDQNCSLLGYRQSGWDNFMQDLQKMHVIVGEMESATVLVLSRLFGLRGGCICVCATNLMSNYEKGINLSEVDYGTDIIQRLNETAVESIYQLYLNDLKKDKASERS